MKKLFIALIFLIFNISISNASIYYFEDLNGLVNGTDTGLFCDVEDENCSYSDSDITLSFEKNSLYMDLGVDKSISYSLTGTDANSVTLSLSSNDSDFMSIDEITLDTVNKTLTFPAEVATESGEVRITLTANNSDDEPVAQDYLYVNVASINSNNMLTLWTVEAGETISFPFNDEYFGDNKYDGNVDWGDSSGIESFEDKTIQSLTHTYTEAGTYEIRIDGGFADEDNFHGMFANQTIPTGMDISQWDVSNVKSLLATFYGATIPSGFDISDWNVSNVTNMALTFYTTTLPTGFNISNWNVSNVKNMEGMFRESTIPSNFDISSWNTRNVTNMAAMFNTISIPSGFDISSWNTSNVTEIQSMFTSSTIPSGFNINTWDVSKVTDMNSIFYDVDLPDGFSLSNWNTSSLINMGSMFYNGSMPDDFDMSNWDVSNVTNMGGTFRAITMPSNFNFSTWDVKNVSIVNSLFNGTTFEGDLLYNETVSSTIYSNFLQFMSDSSNVLADSTTGASIIAGDNACDSQNNQCFIARQHLINKGWNIDDATVDTALTIDESTALKSKWTVSAGETVHFPTYIGTYNGIIDWGDDTVEEFDNLRNTHTYAEAGTYTILMNGNWGDNLVYMFREQLIPDNLDISEWNISTINGMWGTFWGTVFESNDFTDINNWDVSNVTSMTYTFREMDIPSSIDLSSWDISNVKEMPGIFYGATIPSGFDISNWDISNTKHISYMFYGATIPDGFSFAGWDLTKASTISNMFYSANILRNIVYDKTVSSSVYKRFMQVLASEVTYFPNSSTSQKIYVGANTCPTDDEDCLDYETTITEKGWVITRTTAE